MSCHQERVEKAAFTARKGLLCHVQAPSPGRQSPSSEGSPRATHLLGGVRGGWDFSWFRIWLPNDSTPKTHTPRLSWAFLPSSTPGRKPELARVDEELETLSGLSPLLQGEGGQVSTQACPFQTTAGLYRSLFLPSRYSLEPIESYPPSPAPRPGLRDRKSVV